MILLTSLFANNVLLTSNDTQNLSSYEMKIRLLIFRFERDGGAPDFSKHSNIHTFNDNKSGVKQVKYYFESKMRTTQLCMRPGAAKLVNKLTKIKR